MSWIAPRVIRGNRGDIASRYRILEALHSLDHEVNTVFACREAHVPPVMRGKILSYGPLYNLWPGLEGVKALWNARIVAWTGGLDLQDDSSLIKLVHTWLVFASYRMMGLRIVLLMQGAGPLESRTGRWLAARILNLVDLALIRDRRSLELLSELTSPQKLRLAADGIFLGAANPEAAPTHTTAVSRSKPVIGLNVRLWFHFASSWVPYQFARDAYRERAKAPMEQLLNHLAALITHLRMQYDARILLISMYEPGVEPWEDDQPLLDNIKSKFSSDPEVTCVTEDLDIVEFSRLLATLDLMVGTRLHSTLIALREGVPSVHISYTSKGRSIYADLGLEDWVIDIERVHGAPQELIGIVDRVLHDASARDRVRTVVDRVVADNNEQLGKAMALMDRN